MKREKNASTGGEKGGTGPKTKEEGGQKNWTGLLKKLIALGKKKGDNAMGGGGTKPGEKTHSLSKRANQGKERGGVFTQKERDEKQ